VKLLRNNETKTIETNNGDTVESIVTKLGLHPDSLIVLHKSKPVPLDEQVTSLNELTFVEVTSGG